MTTQLIPFEDDKQFLASLNEATGHQATIIIPRLKFNSGSGQWEMETGDKDAEGKPVYEELGESIEFNIITTRNMLATKYDTEPILYSREVMDNFFTLYSDNQEFESGAYQNLKAKYPNLEYTKVLYVFMQGSPYRIKLSKSKLTNLFTYLNQFNQDNPARYYTFATKGQELKNGAVKYYELNFAKGEEILDKKRIVERVNLINSYLDYYANRRSKEDVKTELIDEPPMPEDEIRVEDIPL